MLLSIRHLRMFVALGRNHSVTQTADICRVTQPAVTQAMAKLSQAAGNPLFRRNASGAYLTEAGEVLTRRAVRVLTLLDNATAEMARPLRVQMTWSQLSALIAVAETGNFTLAARSLGIAQPTVHRATSTLEGAAGIVLFQRTAHGLITTRAAERLALAARLALAELEQAESDLAALDGRETGRIVVGALPLSRSVWLPKAILEFRKERPGFPIEVIDGRYDELLFDLRRGEIDLMLGALRLPSPIEDIVQENLFEDEVVIVAGRHHPLAGREAVGSDELNYPWVMPRRGTPIRRILDDALGTGQGDAIETSSIIALRELLRDSDYLGGVSRMQAEVEGETLAILPLRLPGASRPIGLTMRAEWAPTGAQRAFLDILRQGVADLPGVKAG